jgi:ABC-type multidrug transport system fused ATPase/permease subunit
MNRQEVVAYYQAKVQQQQSTIHRCLQRWRAVSYLRGATFLASVALLLLGLTKYSAALPVWLTLAGLMFFVFLAVAFVHEGMQSRLTVARLLLGMHQESLARLDRRWQDIRVPGLEVPKALSAVSADLDLFTETSLFKLLGIVRTPDGIESLCQWISEGATDTEVELRQGAVAELAPDIEWRNSFNLRCEQLGLAKSGPSGFVAWSESGNWFDRRTGLLWLARLTALVSLTAIAGLLTGLVTLQVGFIVLIGTCGINFLLSIVFAGPLHDIFNQISSQANEANHFLNLFDRMVAFPAKSAKLKSLQLGLSTPPQHATACMRSMSQLIGLANIRRNGILFVPYLIFEFLFFWDIHCLDLLERWKHSHGQHVRKWFANLGEWEALCALAKLAWDEPTWSFPRICSKADGAAVKFESLQLGHPLLRDDRVSNDVSVGPPGTVLLVTGSNMSGKSTLLRSIGLNAVLAQMGSVVCARSLQMSVMRIETSMRIADSLADGVSFFMAELKRLKEVVDVAKSLRSDPQKSMLFLLDEILQGTNSRERQIAVSRVVRRLIDEQAIGAISTHDLDLATTHELKEACQTVHFSEQFSDEHGKRQMTFDYRMKPGLAETTNALKLLEMVGLGE